MKPPHDQEPPSKEAYSKEAQELWRDLCEKDNRTSPEEYPELALITEDGFCSTLDRFRAEGVEAERKRCAAIVASESFSDSEAFDRMERNILSGASP